jgi:uncharacterized membrane-anchored protein
MKFKLKKTTLFVLGIISVLLSRLTFFLINDPEGPNLLIVTVLAVVIFFVILSVYKLITLIR